MFMCRNGHLRRQQMCADNCRFCKYNERRRLRSSKPK